MHEPHPHTVELINKKLLDYYGRGITMYANRIFSIDKYSILGTDSSVDLPKFRIVWSTGLTEKRYGEYEIFSESGDVYLRTEKCVEEVEKYPMWPDKYVLEHLLPADGNPYLEKAGIKYSYDPRWVFGNARSNPVPIWKYVQILCDHILNNVREIESPNDIIRKEQAAIEKEKKLFKTMLQNESPYLAGMLHNADGIKSSGVVVDGFRDTLKQEGK